MPPFALQVTRLGLSIVSAIAPDMAGRLAFKLFCTTPSRKPKGERAKILFATGQARLDAAEQVSLAISEGMAMAYRFKRQGCGNGQRYLVVHGWGSGIAYMSDLVSGLAETGAEVIAVDFPGHGRSSGRFLNMRMAVEAIAAAERQFGAFDAGIGHSFGGAALMIATGGVLPEIAPVCLQRLVLIGSPSDMTWLFRGYGRMMRLPARAQAVFEEQVFQVTGRRLGDFDAVRIGRNYGRPVLVLHAQDDKEVSARHAFRYEAAGPHVTLTWANGLGHRRIVSAPDVIAAIVDFAGGGKGLAAA